MDHPSASPADDTGDYIILSYYTIFTIGLPLCILITICYCWTRNRLWNCCCYYDVESALETQPQPETSPGNATGFLCLYQSPTEPARWKRYYPSLPPPERIQEIAESCADCAICAGSLDSEGERCSTLPLCGHRFHKVCVYLWLRQKPTCPVCRRFYPFPVRSKLNLLLSQEKYRLLSCV